MLYCIILIGLILNLSPKHLSDSWVPTLTKEAYIAAKNESKQDLTQNQIIFKEYYGNPNGWAIRRIQIYGNGTILMSDYLSGGGARSYKFYYTNEEGLAMEVAEDIVDLGLFESESRLGFPYPSKIGDNSKEMNYYLTLRLDDDYYTIYFTGKENEVFEWLDIVEYMRSILNEYMIDDNEIDGTEYLEKREEIIEEYGALGRFADDDVERWVEGRK